MLVGREAESRGLVRLLRNAAEGKSGSLVIRGEAGMGKTALLEYASRRAGRTFLVLQVKGVQAESELPFGGLVGLCRPLLGLLLRLAVGQRRSLESALALSPEPATDRLAVFAAFLSLVGIAAEERPVLVLVDDLHWVDRSTADAVVFVSRRLGPDRVAVVMSTRHPASEVLDLGGIPDITLGGLDRRAGVRLLRSVGRSREMPRDVAQQLVDLTGGSPLALLEVPALLSVEQLRGDAPLPDPLPAGDAVRQAFLREVAGLPAGTIAALRIIAADDMAGVDAVQEALADAGLRRDVLEPAEQLGVLEMRQDHFEFRHPLLRSVLYHGASPPQRRAAHAALAAAYAARDPTRNAWHRATAATAPDEGVADDLERAADVATARGGHGSAAMTLERAAELTPSASVRAYRRYRAGLAASLGGLAARAMRNMDAALASADDPILRADIQHARGQLLARTGSLLDAHALLVDEALRIRGLAPARAAEMLATAATVCVAAAHIDQALEAARLATSCARRADRESQLQAALALVNPLILCGRTRVARRLLARWRPAAEESFQPPLTKPFDPIVGTAFSYLDHVFAMRLFGEFHEAARERSPGLLPQVLATMAHVEIHIGEWPMALAHASEASTLARDLNQGSSTSFALAALATVEAGMGRESAREHAHQAIAEAARTATRSMTAYGHRAMGLLELSHGRVHDAIPPLQEAGRLLDEWGVVDPLVIPWMPDLVEASVYAGRASSARDLTARLARLARRTGLEWAAAASARCAGLIADDFDEHFGAALRIHDRLPCEFDRGRTELAYAERLRRSGRRREARPHLHAAIEIFRRLGAAPWRERAEAELGSTAEQVQSRTHAVEGLSPQELQVALLVGGGATNREAAAALFVTGKTVEFHLRNVYQKLGVRSRTELAVLLASQGG